MKKEIFETLRYDKWIPVDNNFDAIDRKFKLKEAHINSEMWTYYASTYYSDGEQVIFFYRLRK